MNEKQFNILRDRYKLVTSEQYKELRAIELNRIVELAASGIDEKELKGMIRLINYTDSFEAEYIKRMEEKRNLQ